MTKAEDLAHRLALLNEMSHCLNLADSEDEVFNLAARYTYRTFPQARRASVVLLNAEEDSFDVFALQEGRISNTPVGVHVPLAEIQREREKSDHLLLNILPEPIAERLKQGETDIVNSFFDVTVLFADIVDFTVFSGQISPQEVVALLNYFFSEFDCLAEQYGLEKIKTIGDAYMAVAGLPTPRADHAQAAADTALAMQRVMPQLNNNCGQSLAIRVGLHSGPVVAGVIGSKKFSYDLWGDTVNTASRMESNSLAGRTHVSQETYQRLQKQYLFEKRGSIPIKGKGPMVTYWLTGPQKDAPSL